MALWENNTGTYRWDGEQVLGWGWGQAEELQGACSSSDTMCTKWFAVMSGFKIRRYFKNLNWDIGWCFEEGGNVSLSNRKKLTVYLICWSGFHCRCVKHASFHSTGLVQDHLSHLFSQTKGFFLPRNTTVPSWKLVIRGFSRETWPSKTIRLHLPEPEMALKQFWVEYMVMVENGFENHLNV